MKIKVALTGNPNSGKTTVFNDLTGSTKEVGNWPGVTVEWVKGNFQFCGYDITLVDLPGIYSLFPHSPEQQAICMYLTGGEEETPDVIVDVVDVTNLERSLYLTSQLIGTGLPVVVGLNMHDELIGRDMEINEKLLAKEMGAPCVKISASHNKGLERLFNKVISIHEDGNIVNLDRFWSHFDLDIQKKVREAQDLIMDMDLPKKINPRWIAMQMLEEHWHGDIPPLLTGSGDEWEALISVERYRVISEIVKAVLNPLDQEKSLDKSTVGHAHKKYSARDVSYMIDKIVCNRIFALPLFFIIMMSVFLLSFGPIGRFLVEQFSYLLLELFPQAVSALLISLSTPAWFQSLIIDGIIAGVGGIMVFLTAIIFTLYMSCYSGRQRLYGTCRFYYR